MKSDLGARLLVAHEQRLEDSGMRTEFETGAVRDMAEGKGRCDLLPAAALLRLARHYEAGAEKYEDRNWEKGLPISSFIDSAMRHLLQYMDGKDDEDHLAAVAWNIMGAMWTEEKKPEMQNLPSRLKESGRYPWGEVQKINNFELTLESLSLAIFLIDFLERGIEEKGYVMLSDLLYVNNGHESHENEKKVGWAEIPLYMIVKEPYGLFTLYLEAPKSIEEVPIIF